MNNTAYPLPSSTPHLHLVDERAAYDAKEPAGGFAMIPRRVLALNDGNAIGLYAILAGYANKQGECWPSIATLAKATGWGRDKVIRTLKTLTAAGVVVADKRDRNGLKQSNRYILPDRNTPNVPMSHNGTTQSHSATLVVPIADSGSRITGREQEPTEQQPKEQETQARAIAVAFVHAVLGKEPSVVGAKDLAVATELLDLGARPEDMPAIVDWMRTDAFWAKGFSLASVKGQYLRWRTTQPRPAAASAGPMTQAQLQKLLFTDFVHKGLYRDGDDGFNAYKADYKAGTLPQLDGSRT